MNGTVNGVNGYDRPSTPPTRGGLALTEYSVNPTTPSAERRERLRKIVPEDFLLEDGNPDVRSPRLRIESLVRRVYLV